MLTRFCFPGQPFCPELLAPAMEHGIKAGGAVLGLEAFLQGWRAYLGML